MPQVIILIIGIIIGIALSAGSCVVYNRRKNYKIKIERQEKALAMFARGNRVSNNDVQSLLGVSDATATRYLDALEKQGKIIQIGQTGRSVFYKLNGSN